jgi:Fe2+ transport system protein FeoA
MSPWKNPTLEPTLANLKPGQEAAVLEVLASSQPACLRLQELGLIPGTPVLVISSSGAVMVQVGEQRLCLREELAESVAVLPL